MGRSAVAAASTALKLGSSASRLPQQRLALTSPLLRAAPLQPCRLLAPPRRWFGSPGEGHEILRHIAEHASQPVSKYSMVELLELQDLPQQERLKHLESVLHVGISNIVLMLRDLPLGFGSVDSIRRIIQDYVQDIRDLRSIRAVDDPEGFLLCISNIYSRHRGMMVQVAKGITEFQSEMRFCFEKFGDYEDTRLVEVGEVVPALRKIEAALDEFFTVRTTLRLLISHCTQLPPSGSREKDSSSYTGVSEGLTSLSGMADFAAAGESRRVGAISLDTRPSMVLIEAYQHAQLMCRKEFQVASPLLVNGMPFHEFLSLGGADQVDTHFPYVDTHLYFVFFEVLRNAMKASIRKVGPGQQPPPIRASLVAGSSLHAENERTVKITDEGEGIRREDFKKVWSYFFHSTDTPHRRLGLPLSRVLVRYFGGEIDLHSIHRRGTDVYIYL